jgi:hypothetical protein
MQAFEVNGLWSLPYRGARRVGGRLRYDPATGATLSLLEVLEEDPSQLRSEASELATSAWGGVADEYFSDGLIVGVVPGDEVTLVGVREIGRPTTLPGVVGHVLSPAAVLRGARIPKGNDLLFGSARFRLEHLTEWCRELGASAITSPWRSDPGVVDISYRRPPPLTCRLPTNGEDLKLGYGFTHSNIFDEGSVRQWPEFLVQFTEPRTLRQILRSYVRPVQDLLTIASGEAVAVLELVVTPANLEDDAPVPGVSVGLEYVPASRNGRQPHPYEFLLPFNELDFATHLPRWFELADRLRVPLNFVLANRYSSSMYGENRVINATSAAESLHHLILSSSRSRVFDDHGEAAKAFLADFSTEEQALLHERLRHLNDPTLRDRLIELRTYAGNAVASLIPDGPAWAGLLNRVRNDIAHGSRSRVEGEVMRALSESLGYVAEVCLIRQLGFEIDAIREMANETPRYEWIERMMRAFVDPLLKPTDESTS